MRTLSVCLFFSTEIRTYGNTNIKKSLIRYCDTDKSRTDKVRRINNSHTWKRSLSNITVTFFFHYETEESARKQFPKEIESARKQ